MVPAPPESLEQKAIKQNVVLQFQAQAPKVWMSNTNNHWLTHCAENGSNKSPLSNTVQ